MPASTSSVKRGRTDRPHSGAPAPHINDPDGFIWPYGKYRGQQLRDLPDDYLEFIARSTYDPDQRALVEAELADRNAELLEDPCQVAEPSGALAADVLPLLVFTWEQAMRAKFPDLELGSDAELVFDRGVTTLRAICTAHTGRRWPTPAELGEADGVDRS